jgi:hypothetical protein
MTASPTASTPHVRPSRRSLRAALMTALLAVVAFGGVALSAPSNADELLKDEKHRLALANKTYEGGNKAGSARNMVVVGKNSIGGRGFNADVWGHDGYAYVGHWGFTDWATGNTRFCPADLKNGVAVIDTRTPASPKVVATLENPAGTSAEDIVVFTARYGPLAGHDIAVAGIQVCGGSRYDTAFKRGTMLWDVTNPAAPVELALLDSGCCTRGVHELEVQHRTDLGRTFVYESVPTSEYVDSVSPSGRRDELGRGDFRLVDITDPANPWEVSNWGVIHNNAPHNIAGQGCDKDGEYGHSAEPSNNGKLAFLSWWDSGFIAINLTDPANPVFKGRTVYPANADGDGHSSTYDDARKLLFTADEDFCKASGAGIEKGFGYLRVYDYSVKSAPRQIARFRTPNSTGTTDISAGDYTIHNPMLHGTDVYISWYSDGVRVVDASDPTRPREVAYFVPPAIQNVVKPSQRGVLSNTTQVWGVFVDEDRDLVLASDMNSGLWILRRTDPH